MPPDPEPPVHRIRIENLPDDVPDERPPKVRMDYRMTGSRIAETTDYRKADSPLAVAKRMALARFAAATGLTTGTIEDVHIDVDEDGAVRSITVDVEAPV